MFAIAWKSVRQVRWVACLSVATLLMIYAASALTRWSAFRGFVLFFAVGVVAVLVGSLTFSEDRRAGTQVFLSSLPVGRLRCWGATVSANFLVTLLSTAALLAVVLLVDRGVDFGFVAPWMIVPLAAMMLFLWATATFYSTLYEEAIIAMIAAVLTLALGVTVMGVMSDFFEANVQRGFGRVIEGPWRRALWGPGAFTLALVVAAVVLLAGSLIYHGARAARRGIAARIAAVVGTVVLAFVAALGVHVARIVASVTRTEMKQVAQAVAVIDGIGALPQRDAVLALHDRKLHRWSPSAEWQTYDAVIDVVPRRPDGTWIVGPDENTLLVERYPSGRLTAPVVAFLTARALLFGSPFNPLNPGASPWTPRERFLLDLNTGDLRPLTLPGLEDAALFPLGWRGDPPKLHVAAIHYGAPPSAVAWTETNPKSMEILTLSETGDLIETIPMPEVDSSFAHPMPSRADPPRPGSISAWPQLQGDLLYTRKVRSEMYTLPDGRSFPRPAYYITLVTNLKTRENRLVDASSSPGVLAVSPDLNWQLALDPQAIAAWDRPHSFPDVNRRGLIQLSPRESADLTAPGSFLLEKGSARTLVSALSPAAVEARIDFQFVGDRLFFALLTEVAKPDTPGFDAVGLPLGPPGSTESRTETRRVRALAVDLQTGLREEAPLPAHVASFLVHPDGNRVLCQGTSLATAPDAPPETCMVILDLPRLDSRITYRWPATAGPFLGVPGYSPAFLNDDTLVLSQWNGISLWKIGPEPPQTIPFPAGTETASRSR